MTATALFFTVMGRDIRLALRRPSDALYALFFFVVTATLFPLATSPEAALLRAIGPGVLWVSALLATLILLGDLFESDWRDGTLEQLLLSPLPFTWAVIAKITARWLTCAVPLVLVSPLLGLQFELGTTALLLLPLTLALGTLALAFIGSVGAALTLGLRNGSMLLALLVLPLFVPVLVFGAMAVAQADSSRIEAELSVLAAFALLAVFFSPFATAASLRLACE